MMASIRAFDQWVRIRKKIFRLRKELEEIIGMERKLRVGALADEHKYTKRQLQVLQLIQEDKCNKEIGAIMHISESAVKYHIGRMLLRDGGGNRRTLLLKIPEDQRRIP
jgi:DNA-binding NarL/FixJ family response regulator